MGRRRAKYEKRVPEQFPYVPNPEADREVFVASLGPPIDGWHPELAVRYNLYRGKYVDWSISINVHADSAVTLQKTLKSPRRYRVERIDCCHSQIHIHRFTIDSDPDDDLGERTQLIALTRADEDVVDKEYDRQMERVSLEFEEIIRRWTRGS